MLLMRYNMSSSGSPPRFLAGDSQGSSNDPIRISSGSEGEGEADAKYNDGAADDADPSQQYTTAAVRCASSKDPYKGKRFRWWFFTWNNPTHPDDHDSLKSGGFGWIKFQYERGKNGTPHYQGLLYSKSLISCRALMQRFAFSYLAPVININNASDYCGKEDTRIEGPWEYGKFPKQGERSDLLKTKTIIDEGGSMEDVFEQCYGSAVRYHRGIEKYHQIKTKHIKRTWNTICYVYYGDAGTGKTEAAKEESRVFGGGTYWLVLEGGTFGKVWWDGYNGEANIVIDEFNCQLKFTDFKRLIDSTPLQVPVKGGMVPFLGKRVWILSNTPPGSWYPKATHTPVLRNSLNRRLHYQEIFDVKFQGQPDYDSFIFSRSQFVVAQQAGEYRINTH